MRVNLLFNNQGSVRSGYLNVDPLADGKDARLKGFLHDLRDHVEANEAQEIVANDVLDCFSADMVDGVLKHWAGRLAHGGELAVSAADLNAVCRAVLGGKIELAAANDWLHRGGSKLSSLTIGALTDKLRTLGLEVVSARIEGLKAVVRARRP